MVVQNVCDALTFLLDNIFIRFGTKSWELKSRIVQKHTFFAPERYTAVILYTGSLNSASYETTV